MAQQNTIAVQIPDEELNQIKAALGTLKTRLVPYLQTLSAQDRQELPKMGDKTLAFVQKTFEYGKQNPDLVPTYLDMQAMKST